MICLPQAQVLTFLVPGIEKKLIYELHETQCHVGTEKWIFLEVQQNRSCMIFPCSKTELIKNAWRSLVAKHNRAFFVFPLKHKRTEYTYRVSFSKMCMMMQESVHDIPSYQNRTERAWRSLVSKQNRACLMPCWGKQKRVCILLSLAAEHIIRKITSPCRQQSVLAVR